MTHARPFTRSRQPALRSSIARWLTFTLPAAVLFAACDADEPDTAVQTFASCNAEFTITEPNPSYAWTPNAIELVSEELAPGVHAVYDANAADHGPAGIPVATSAGFVIGDDGVVLIETMINRQLFCQLIGLVQAQTDKPIRYAINTSYHGDHSYGNAFLPDDVHIVQHQRTADHIAEHFEADVAFMEANFGADQGIDEVFAKSPDTAVTDAGWSVDLGGVTVEARYHGFGQTHGDLFVYVPEANVLWTGNPLVSEQPAIPWLLDGQAGQVELTLSQVRASLPDGAIVIPGHGQPLARDAFDFAIDYLGGLQTEVQTAVDAGHTEEQTVASVTMESFQGYALWDWVHGQVNVPITYNELNAASE